MQIRHNWASAQQAAMWTVVVQVSVRMDVKAADDVLVGRMVGWQPLAMEGALTNAGGLALLADRWLVNISLQFVLPGSPASFHISLHHRRVEVNPTSDEV